jgi:crotonobetainyl-CoA:carnitine CoA-transferase CaiB-like acyl-CoA transferase
VTADLKDEQARERVLALAPGFDVVVEKDGGVAIAMTPCPVVGRALDLPGLAQYDTNALMLEHRAEIYAALAARLPTGTTAHWLAALLTHDVWCAPVQDYDEEDG